MKAFNINVNALLAFFHDALALVGSWVVAYLLLHRQGSDAEALAFLGWALALALLVQGIVNAAFGVYQGIWRYTSVPDVQRIVAGAVAGTGIMGLALAFTPGASLTLPYFIIQPMILILSLI